MARAAVRREGASSGKVGIRRASVGTGHRLGRERVVGDTSRSLRNPVWNHLQIAASEEGDSNNQVDSMVGNRLDIAINAGEPFPCLRNLSQYVMFDFADFSYFPRHATGKIAAASVVGLEPFATPNAFAESG
jgi:hypothetical protein